MDSKLGVKFSYDDFDLIFDMIGSSKEMYRYKSFRVNYIIFKIITKLLNKWGYTEITQENLTLDKTLIWSCEITPIDDYSRYHNITISIFSEDKDKPTYSFYLSYDGIIKIFYKDVLEYEYTRRSLNDVLDMLSNALVPLKNASNGQELKGGADLDTSRIDISKEIEELITSNEDLVKDFYNLKEYDEFLKRIKKQYDTISTLQFMMNS